MSAFIWSDASVREALGLPADGGAGAPVYAGVSTDSRTVTPGALYVALVGERFDGHDFVAEAVANGAAGAVVSRPIEAGRTPLYQVPDTLAALGALAAFRRRRIRVPVVGITGSAGKTTTKELTHGALAGTMRVHATLGNMNNRVGMPLTLLATPDDAQVVVLEMGTNEPGEIGILARIARPDIGVVITVGEAHLEKLGSVEGVLHEKLDMIRNMAPGGRGLVGDEPEALAAAARQVAGDVRVAGLSSRADADLRAEALEPGSRGGYRFDWRGHPVDLGIPGKHTVVNALLALAVAETLGIPPEHASTGVASVTAGAMRSEIIRVGGLTVLVDCYNANPPSVKAALALLGEAGDGRKVAVLGTMLELGPAGPELHRSALEWALAAPVDVVVAIGAFAEAAEGVDDPRLLTARDWGSAYLELRERLKGDEVVLLKASRGVALEGMLPLLAADFGGVRGGG